MDDKIDIDGKRRGYRRVLERIRESQSMVPENKMYALKYLQDSELGKTILKGRKRRIGIARNLRVAQFLIQIDGWFKKPYVQVTIQDMEQLIEKIETGKIRHKHTGTPYTPETRSSIKAFLRKYWKWLKGNCKIYPPEVEWIDPNEEHAKVPAIQGLLESVEKIAKSTSDLLERAVVMTLFDSGARPEEFLNVRIKDVNEARDGVLSIHIRYSKTFARQICLPIATPYLRSWLEKHPYRSRPEAQAFPMRRGHKLRSMIRRLSRTALGTDVTPYMFRHSGATFWATHLDRASFCKRFGWRYTSRAPDRYIDMAQVDSDQAVLAYREFKASQDRNPPGHLSMPTMGETRSGIGEEVLKKLVQVEQQLAQLGAGKIVMASGVTSIQVCFPPRPPISTACSRMSPLSRSLSRTRTPRRADQPRSWKCFLTGWAGLL